MGSAGLNTSGNENRKWDENAKRIQLFEEKGLYPAILSEKHTSNFSCVILPSFDFSYDENDSAFKESYVPCRDKNNLDEENRYTFTGWFLTIKGYVYYGKGYSTFMSPVTWHQPDPINDIYRLVIDMKNKGDHTYDPLLNFSTNKCTAIARPTNLYLINIWGTGANEKAKDQAEEKNRVLLLKQMAFERLRNDLNLTGCVDKMDPEWPNHLFGDPTNPKRAIICTNKSYPSPNNAQIRYQGLYLGQTRFMGGKLILDARFRDISVKMLQGRYMINNILHFPEYDEILDLIVSEGVIPYELITRACADKTSSLPKPPVKVYSPLEEKDTPKSLAPEFSPELVGATPVPQVAPAAAPSSPSADGWTSAKENEWMSLQLKLSKVGELNPDNADFVRYMELDKERATVFGSTSLS